MDRKVDYDSVASTFEERYVRNQYAGVRDGLLRFLGEERPRVLEVGCGTGHWLQTVSSSARLTAGVDPSQGMLQRAKVAAPDALIARAAAEAIPFVSASFDRIFVINATHHFTSVESFVEETRRLLAPGGGVTVVGLDPHVGVDRWWVYDYFPTALAADLRRYPSAAAIRQLLADAKFTDIQTRVTQTFESSVAVHDAEKRGALDRTSTSQLLVIDDAEWESGIARVLSAPDALLDTDIRFYATTAWLPL